MKKIIKEGNVKVEKFKCDKCGYEFESDEYSVDRTVATIRNDICREECPTCGIVIYKY